MNTVIDVAPEYFECSCHSREHLIRAYIDRDDDRENPLDIVGLDFVLGVGPERTRGWFYRLRWRLKTSFKVLVGINVEIEDCWEMPLGMDDDRVRKLANYLLKAVNNST